MRQVELEGTIEELRNRLKERDNEVVRMQQQQQQFQAASQQQQQQQIEKLQQQLSQQVREMLSCIGECDLQHRERRVMSETALPFLLYSPASNPPHTGVCNSRLPSPSSSSSSSRSWRRLRVEDWKLNCKGASQRFSSSFLRFFAQST